MTTRRYGPAPRLSEEQVRAIRADFRTSATIAADYGVSRSLITLIKSGLRYKWVK